MGLRAWILNKLFQPKDISKDKINAALDDYIMSSQKEHQVAISTANKLLKGKLLQQQAREVTQKIHDLDADYEDEPEKEGMEDKIVGALLQNILTSKPKQTQSQNPNDFFDEQGAPIAPTAPSNPAVDMSLVSELAKTLTPEQTKILKDKGIL